MGGKAPPPLVGMAERVGTIAGTMSGRKRWGHLHLRYTATPCQALEKLPGLTVSSWRSCSSFLFFFLCGATTRPAASGTMYTFRFSPNPLPQDFENSGVVSLRSLPYQSPGFSNPLTGRWSLYEGLHLRARTDL